DPVANRTARPHPAQAHRRSLRRMARRPRPGPAAAPALSAALVCDASDRGRLRPSFRPAAGRAPLGLDHRPLHRRVRRLPQPHPAPRSGRGVHPTRRDRGRITMTKTVAYHWHLRKVMNEHGMQSTTDLVPLLADRGVVMTSTQVYRIVTGQPERLNMAFLSALCDIFGCTPADLIEPYAASSSQRGRKTGTAGAAKPPTSGSKNRPTRATIHGADES